MLYQLSYASLLGIPNLSLSFLNLPATRDKVQKIPQRNSTCKQSADTLPHFRQIGSAENQKRSTSMILPKIMRVRYPVKLAIDVRRQRHALAA
jgi:hypothetical protein